MLKLDLSAIPEGSSHIDLREESSELDMTPEGGRLASPVSVSLDVTRNGDEVFICGKARVTAVLGCARCLEEYRCEIESPIQIVCIIGLDEHRGSGREESENVISLPRDSKVIDLTDLVRGELLVLVPLKPLCSADCRGLCSTCGTNLNIAKCSCSIEKHDDRWDALRKLKKQH